jgi:hypothetical protein
VGCPGPPAPAPPGSTPSTANKKVQDSQVGRLGFGPTYRFAASLEVGMGASIGILKTGYPRIQALSQDKEQGVHPRAAT